ncbi:hypothetical protein [Janthinobacterium agaricidamnosum]|uniref:hypothetical protein n=1 Tax=Janthinobacterium agaricidamnosum TaxID=55508 RepID=UPI0013CF28A4|nr:hypothetical protein [Janthinobacterium agaricidamnosum]
MTWSTTQPAPGASAALGEQGGHAQQEPHDGALPVDPGHVRTRQHYEAMLEEQRASQ